MNYEIAIKIFLLAFILFPVLWLAAEMLNRQDKNGESLLFKRSVTRNPAEKVILTSGEEHWNE